MTPGQKEPLDLVVLGGGITGAGIARDAALRGMRVALFEKNDFASGTSSKSSKLIHGGLRYLEQGDLALVFESVSERQVQVRLAPHLVRPVKFLVPVYKGTPWGLELLNIGLWIYDMFALFRSPALHKTFRGAKALDKEPLLNPENLVGAIEYYDCFSDDARLVLENILDAESAGAHCYNYHEVVSVDWEHSQNIPVGTGRRSRTLSTMSARRGSADNRIRAVFVKDILTGEVTRVETKALAIAAGPWTDQVAARLGLGYEKPLLRPTKGVHLVFPKDVLPVERIITMRSPIDQRIMFVIPWRDRLVVGTTDTDFHDPPDAASLEANAQDVHYLCESVNRWFPGAKLSPEQVIATWSGLRPLIHEEAETASDVSREHQIYVREDGIFLIAGGKLTTYRLMAKQMVESTLRWLNDNYSDLFEERKLKKPNTKDRPLPGAVGLSSLDNAGLEQLILALTNDGIAPELAQHLVAVYGGKATTITQLIAKEPTLGQAMQSDLQFVWAEVAYAIAYEKVRTAGDILERRVPLFLLGRAQGLDVLDRVVAMLGDARGWDDAQRNHERQVYEERVAQSRRFQTLPR